MMLLRRPIFWLLLIFAATFAYGEGPLFRHKDGKVDQEFEQVYQDLRGKPSDNDLEALSDGVTDASEAEAGKIGEVYEEISTAATAINTATWVNVASLSLTAGDWDVTGLGYINNAASCTGFQLAISTNTGDTSTDHVLGSNQGANVVAANSVAYVSIPDVRHNYAASKTVYLKAKSLGANTTMAGVRLKARRKR